MKILAQTNTTRCYARYPKGKPKRYFVSHQTDETFRRLETKNPNPDLYKLEGSDLDTAVLKILDTVKAMGLEKYYEVQR